MIIIADSGSTKTQWSLVYNNKVETTTTIGLNPYHVNPGTITRVVADNISSCAGEHIDAVYFYGSGVTPEMQQPMKDILTQAFGQDDGIDIQAESDMLGAARALFGDRKGIACIMGTGSNSCYYNGTRIEANTPALGYILGDEGSGTSIGKRLVNALYKNSSLGTLRALFEKEYSLTQADIIDRVYSQPMANRFLASLAPFVKKHIDNLFFYSIVYEEFTDFFVRNLRPYPSRTSVGFVGSIAYHFATQLRDCAKAQGYKVVDIVQSPMEGLIKYHKK